MSAKVIRNPDFAQRLEMACDQYALCPPLHKGRYQWIVDEFGRRFNESITTETVRKWSKGEARPKQDKNALLAQLLQVDPTWLYMGIDADLEPRERKARNAMASGVVNVVAGLIQMDGGTPAFPEEEGVVDIHAIIKGAAYSFHVALGSGRRFVVPTKYETAVVLGVIRDGMSFRIYELTPEIIETGPRRGGSIEIELPRGVKPISGFDRRL